MDLELGYADRFCRPMKNCIDAFKKQMQYFIDIKIKGSNVIEKIYAEEMPVPFLVYYYK